MYLYSHIFMRTGARWYHTSLDTDLGNLTKRAGRVDIHFEHRITAFENVIERYSRYSRLDALHTLLHDLKMWLSSITVFA